MTICYSSISNVKRSAHLRSSFWLVNSLASSDEDSSSSSSSSDEARVSTSERESICEAKHNSIYTDSQGIQWVIQHFLDMYEKKNTRWVATVTARMY